MVVHHLAVVVRDLQRAERFYVDVLGLSLLRRWHDSDGLRAVWLSLGEGAFLALERFDSVESELGNDKVAIGWHCVALGIATQEREHWRARLNEAGHPVFRETDYTLYVRDPEGNVIGLSHYPEPKSVIS